MSAYSAVVLADTPISYWQLDELSGSTAVDQIGTNSATYSGTPTLGQTGIPGTQPGGTSVNFALTRASHADTASLNFVAPFTVECWMQTTASGSIVAKYDTSNSFHGYGVRHASNVINFWTGSGAWFLGATTLSLNTWYHVVCVLVGTTATIYLNGVVDATGTTGVSLTNTAVFAIGCDNLSTAAVKWIDEVAVYNYALSAGRVLVHYNAGINTPPVSSGNPAAILPAM